jgi:protein-S-isoprenylcysteine O-methyltransferase Ste14
VNLPRWLALPLSGAVWLVGVPVAHGVVPWAISLVGPRWGWTDAGPALWNLLGLIPVGAGTAFLGWTMVYHLSGIPARVEVAWTPQYLLLRGPYRLTRNPMYVGELLLWLGWAIVYGSALVFIVGALLAALMNFRAIPHEESQLEAEFGREYLAYKRQVPRWLGPRGEP